jgi:hypothetical protein
MKVIVDMQCTVCISRLGPVPQMLSRDPDADDGIITHTLHFVTVQGMTSTQCCIEIPLNRRHVPSPVVQLESNGHSANTSLMTVVVQWAPFPFSLPACLTSFLRSTSWCAA